MSICLPPPHFCNTYINFISPAHLYKPASTSFISDKMKSIALGCFKAGTSLYLSSFGGSEILQNLKKSTTQDTPLFKRIVRNSTAYLNLHGSFMMGCGLTSLLDALHSFGVVNLGNFTNAVRKAGNLLFLSANIIALEEGVRLFEVIQNTDWSKTNIEEKELNWLKRSVFCGILSNLGYCLATASLLFGGPTAITVLLAIFSCFSGGIKIIYDLFLWAKEQNIVYYN
jgi:hypothetical protein